MHFLKNFRIERHLTELLFVLAMVTMLLFAELSSFVYAEVECWEISAGDKEIAVLSTKADAEKTVKEVENYYTDEDSSDVTVSVEPAITVSQKKYRRVELPKQHNVEEAVEKVIEGTSGDDPDIKITTTQVVQSKKKIKSKEVVKKSDEILEDAVEVKTKGKPGYKIVTEELTTVNGEKENTEVIEQDVIKEAMPTVILEGTKEDTEEDSEDNEGSAGRAFNVYEDGDIWKADLDGEKMGQKVLDYAMNFVGNPYVWGGESLTKGADCSGFVLAIYKHFGISLPHDAHAQRDYGKEVSLDEARAGDLICFHGHIGIYMGDEHIVHAMNESNGITTSKLGYNGKPIVTIRRLFA